MKQRPDPESAPHGVDLWTVPLEQPDDSGLAMLTRVEHARAGRRSGRGRVEFLACRVALRRILAGYLDVDPGELRFRRGAHGKPHIAWPDHPGLRFNLSHTDGLMLVAVTRGAPVGVDVERVRPFPDALRVAERFFSPAERAALEATPPPARDLAFFGLWTRKEAYLKARGLGLAHPLRAFQVSVPPDPPRLLAPAPEAARWSLLAPEVPPGYVAALAVRAHATAVSLRPWP